MPRVRVATQLTAEEVPRVRALIDAAREHDGVSAIGEHKFLRVSSGAEVPGVTALLAYHGGKLVGYANTEQFPIAGGRRLSAEIVVDPGWRRHGTASALLEEVLREARQQAVDRVDIWAYRQLSGTRELAAKFGFQPSRALLEIRTALPEQFPEAPLPEGVALRAFLPERDSAEWLALNNLVFASHPEQGAWDDADLAARLEQPWFDARDFLVAERQGRLVAYNWLKLDHASKEGEIYVIGVHPAERRRHFGRSLTVLGLRHMRQRGMEQATAYVDAENSNALAMYYSLGFSLDHTDLCYSKALR
jgi:mycothiol synthase